MLNDILGPSGEQNSTGETHILTQMVVSNLLRPSLDKHGLDEIACRLNYTVMEGTSKWHPGPVRRAGEHVSDQSVHSMS